MKQDGSSRRKTTTDDNNVMEASPHAFVLSPSSSSSVSSSVSSTLIVFEPDQEQQQQQQQAPQQPQTDPLSSSVSSSSIVAAGGGRLSKDQTRLVPPQKNIEATENKKEKSTLLAFSPQCAPTSVTSPPPLRAHLPKKKKKQEEKQNEEAGQSLRKEESLPLQINVVSSKTYALPPPPSNKQNVLPSVFSPGRGGQGDRLVVVTSKKDPQLTNNKENPAHEDEDDPHAPGGPEATVVWHASLPGDAVADLKTAPKSDIGASAPLHPLYADDLENAMEDTCHHRDEEHELIRQQDNNNNNSASHEGILFSAGDYAVTVDQQRRTSPTTRRRADHSSNAVYDAEVVALAETSELIRAELVVEQGQNHSNMRNGGEREDRVAVEAAPLVDSHNPSKLCIRTLVILVVTVTLILGAAIVGTLIATDVLFSKQQNTENSSQEVTTVAQPDQGESSTDTNVTLAPTRSLSPSASPTLGIAAHYMSLLPDFTREAIGVFLSPQYQVFHLFLQSFQSEGFEVPSDITYVDLFGTLTFYITSNGQFWTDFAPRNIKKFDTCRYPFFGCDPVTETFTNVTLQGYGVLGYIPPELGLVRNLSFIDVSHNFIGQSIPGELGLLRKLRYADFSFNQFSGSFPTMFLELTPPVSTIGLDNNLFNGSLAPEWALLNKTLETLHMHSNDFSGTIPHSWSALSNLQQLSLHDNPRLSGHVPSGLCAMVDSGNLNLTLDCSIVSCACDCQCIDDSDYG